MIGLHQILFLGQVNGGRAPLSTVVHGRRGTERRHKDGRRSRTHRRGGNLDATSFQFALIVPIGNQEKAEPITAPKPLAGVRDLNVVNGKVVVIPSAVQIIGGTRILAV